MSNLKLRVTILAVTAAVAGHAIADDKEKKNNPNAVRAKPNPNLSAPRSLSPQNLQDNVNLKGIASQNPQSTQLSGSRDDARPGQSGGGESPKAKALGLGGETGSTPGKEGSLGEGKAIGGAASQIKGSIGNQGPVTGAKYGDTFGGGRVNNDAQSGGTGNFKGGGKGNAGESDSDKIYDSGGNYVGTRGELTKSGKEQNSGGFTAKEWEAMRNDQTSGGFSNKELSNMKAQQEKDLSGGFTKKELADMKVQQEKELAAQQGKTTKTPRDDDMGSGGAPMGRQDAITNQRGIAGRTQGAGGKGDGRADQQASGSNGAMISRDKADGIQREGGVSNINMDKALEINQKVNPGRQ